MTSVRRTLALLVAGAIATPLAAGETREARQLRAAEEVIERAVTAPDKGIPTELLQRAECVGVFPEVRKGAFVVGAEFGRGLFTCRREDGTMGPPAFFTIGGASVGWQAGGKEADLILLIMNKDGVKHLLQDKFTLGGEVAATAGPVGRTAEAATDAQLQAQIISWSRSRGVFLGASLEGSVVSQNKEAIERVYGKPLTARDLLVDQAARVPRLARSYVKVLNERALRPS